MKSTIVKCIEDLVIEKFGQEKWQKALVTAGLPGTTKFFAVGDFEDAKVMALVKSLCQTLGVTLEQLSDVFGDYWVNVYAQKYYAGYFVNINNSRDFILNMDKLHDGVTKTVPNAHPPRFKYVEISPKKLQVEYLSSRGLIDIAVGLARGVGKHYNERLQVTKLSPTKFEVTFP